MALVNADRVQQQGTANTTVSFTLTSTVTGYQSFAVIGNGNNAYYTATDQSGNWEVGLGTYSTTGPTLTRASILSSSNSGAAVSTFGSPVNVFVTYPAEQAVQASNNPGTSGYILTSNGTGALPSWNLKPTVLPVTLNNGTTVVNVALANGSLPVLLHDGVTTINVTVS